MPVSQPCPVTPVSQFLTETVIPQPSSDEVQAQASTFSASVMPPTPMMPFSLPPMPFRNQVQSMSMPFLPWTTNSNDSALNQLQFNLAMSYLYYNFAMANANADSKQ
ncbi:hypothetical protein Pmani_014985 [Petrolisthes manimaculis]|uniref:Uncharacterized protein n=1 Tax=Petrolisthes manimaculis TaxID=1843537 RepID=A0AAE1PRV6_9EUCA|nr:hypothetical protein Pmani_014985 [Petrolisthes manimaculis]